MRRFHALRGESRMPCGAAARRQPHTRAGRQRARSSAGATRAAGAHGSGPADAVRWGRSTRPRAVRPQARARARAACGARVAYLAGGGAATTPNWARRARTRRAPCGPHARDELRQISAPECTARAAHPRERALARRARSHLSGVSPKSLSRTAAAVISARTTGRLRAPQVRAAELGRTRMRNRPATRMYLRLS